MKPARRAYEWACQKTFSPFAPLWLFLIFLFEIILLLPMDALLMLFCMQNPKRRFWYASSATFASLIAGLIGYSLGFWLWDIIGGFVTTHLISHEFFDKIVLHYNEYEHLAVFLGSLFPIPFKAITLSAGVCHLPIQGYLIALLLARGVRFFLVAELMNRWGEQIKSFVDRNFNHLLWAVVLKVLVTIAFFWILGS